MACRIPFVLHKNKCITKLDFIATIMIDQGFKIQFVVKIKPVIRVILPIHW